MTQLTLRFIGLNLFVVNRGADTLHVLLPMTPRTASDPGPSERHHAAIRYPWQGRTKTVLVNDTRIRIPSSTRAVPAPFQKGLVNISSWSGGSRKVDPHLLDGASRKRLNAHFVIPGGQVRAVDPMGVWKLTLPGQPVQELYLAPEIHVSAEISANSLNLLDCVQHGAGGNLDTLVAGPNGIEFKVLHVEDRELQVPPDCPVVKKGDRSDHFPAFYQLFNDAVGPDIVFDRVEPPGAPMCPPLSVLETKSEYEVLGRDGITPFSCMAGGGGVGP